MPFSQTTRFNLWKVDTGTVDQSTGDKIKANTDVIDANLGKVMADSGDNTAGFLSERVDDIGIGVDISTHRLYHKFSRLVHNMASDANYTLTAGQERYEIIGVTDTGNLLTAGRDIIVPAIVRIYYFENLTSRTLTIKTASGSGVAVSAGNRALLACNGSNVVNLTTSGGGGSGDMLAATYDPAAIAQQLVGISATQTLTNKRIHGNIIDLTTGRTLTASDSSAYLFVNSSSSQNIVLPQNSTENLSVGFQCIIIRQGTGAVNINREGSDTINGAAANKAIQSQNKAVTVVKKASGSWWVLGDI